LFFLQLEVVGSTMGTRTEFEGLLKFLGETGVRPHIQQVFSLEDAKQGYELMHKGDIQGKLVIVP
jgi:D-arabinose 1-dehydrogenase-like Zn-dependent alcohol dehydrogenase